MLRKTFNKSLMPPRVIPVKIICDKKQNSKIFWEKNSIGRNEYDIIYLNAFLEFSPVSTDIIVCYIQCSSKEYIIYIEYKVKLMI